MRSYWWTILAITDLAWAENNTVQALSERTKAASVPTTSAALEVNNFIANGYGKDTSCQKSTVYIPKTETCTVTSTFTSKTTTTKISTCTETEVCHFKFLLSCVIGAAVQKR
jgi:hypothetical protein